MSQPKRFKLHLSSRMMFSTLRYIENNYPDSLHSAPFKLHWANLIDVLGPPGNSPVYSCKNGRGGKGVESWSLSNTLVVSFIKKKNYCLPLKPPSLRAILNFKHLVYTLSCQWVSARARSLWIQCDQRNWPQNALWGERVLQNCLWPISLFC